MNHGIAQGFVRFDSVACYILRQLHARGPLTSAELSREQTHSEQVQMSATLIRLRNARMVYIVGRHRPTGKRSHALYDLQPRNNHIGPPVLSLAEKQKNYRERRKIKVASVFDFRGTIQVRG